MLNGMDNVALERNNYKENPQPSLLTHGPKNRREFLNFLKWS